MHAFKHQPRVLWQMLCEERAHQVIHQMALLQS
jgi:hypothetical protein